MSLLQILIQKLNYSYEVLSQQNLQVQESSNLAYDVNYLLRVRRVLENLYLKHHIVQYVACTVNILQADLMKYHAPKQYARML